MKKILPILISILLLSPTVVWAIPITYPYNGGTGLSGLPANSLIVGNGFSPVTSTSSPTVGQIYATSTTATSTFLGNVMIGNANPNFFFSGLFPTDATPQLQVSNNGNDLLNELTLQNVNGGAYAASCMTYQNNGTSGAGVTAADYASDCLSGPNFNNANAPGGGLFAGSLIPGLPPNSLVRVASDGWLLFGALSANTASSTVAWTIGPGYAVGNYDMVLKNISNDSINIQNAGLGIGSTTPYARLSITASTSQTFPRIVVNTTTNGKNNGIKLIFDQNNRLGLSTSSPYRTLSVYGSSDLGTNALAGSFTGTSTATSTLGGGISMTRISTTATSTLTAGINISSGCFAVNNVCTTAGGASLSGGSPNTLTYWTSATEVGATSSPTVGYVTATSTTATSTFLGALGIGTSSPVSTFATVGTSTLNGDTTVGPTNTTNVFTVDRNGHILTGGSSPTMGSCGVSPSLTGGDDNNFYVTAGSGVLTSCTINFANTWQSSTGSRKIAPACHADDVAATALALDASSTPTTVTVTATSLTSVLFSVQCAGSDNMPAS